jgi:hypothetical protein
MKTRTHFQFRVDVWDDAGNEIVEHIAGSEDLDVTQAAYAAAVKRWRKARITLRQGSLVVHDTGQREVKTGRRRIVACK